MILAWHAMASMRSWWKPSCAAEHQCPRARACRVTALAAGYHEHSIIHGTL